MSETPSWLTEETVSAAAQNKTVQKAATAAANAAIEEEKKKYFPSDEEEQRTTEASLPPIDVDPEELKQMQKWSLILRVVYMALSICMAAAAFLVLEKANISTLFVALYVFFFAIIICCFELALKGVAKWMSENFGFMYTLTGRLMFIVFVAVLCFDLGLFGIIVMAALLAAVCVNIYVFMAFPKYEAWLRQKHYEQLKGAVN
jgi:cation transport ATPase